jgi:hypothetical protein
MGYLVATLLFFAFVASIQAECAWILWEEISTYDGKEQRGSTKLNIHEAYENRTQCVTNQERV